MFNEIKDLVNKAVSSTKQETKVNWKNKVWKYATAFVVALIILNPEMAELALFIDAIGLELFLMLLEVQVIALAGALFHTSIKPISILTKRVWLKLINAVDWDNAKEGIEGMMLAVSAPVILMNLLVVSAAIGIVFNVH
jgi:hypothetical protein